MRVIGVIDLLGGRAVHARGGCRHGYHPVAMAGGTPVAGDATALARMYVDRLGIDELYIADLDAIAGGTENDAPVRAIASTGATVWLDAGISTASQARRARDRGASVVVGLETLTSFAALHEIVGAIAPARVVFSLDLRDGRPLAANPSMQDLPLDSIAAAAVDAGAESVIVLDLGRIGAERGPDLATLNAVRGAIPFASLLAAGGVRDESDLRDLIALGCDGVLMATALHGPAGADLVRFATTLTASR